MDGVLDYLPDPSQVNQKAFHRESTAEGPKETPIDLKCDEYSQFVSFAFKLEENKYGQLTYCRAYQGKLTKGDQVFNVKEQKKIRVNRIVKMHAN